MRIGELAQRAGVNPKTLRFYEKAGLIPPPPRTPSGYRDYTSEHVRRLVFVKAAQRLGLTLADIREILARRDRGERPCRHVLDLLDRQVAELDARITEMSRRRAQLLDVNAHAAGLPRTAGDGFCPVIEHRAARPPGPHNPTLRPRAR